MGVRFSPAHVKRSGTIRRSAMAFVVALLMAPLMVFTTSTSAQALTGADEILLGTRALPLLVGANATVLGGGATVTTGGGIAATGAACVASVVCAVAVVAGVVLVGGAGYLVWREYNKDVQGSTTSSANNQFNSLVSKSVTMMPDGELAWTASVSGTCAASDYKTSVPANEPFGPQVTLTRASGGAQRLGGYSFVRMTNGTNGCILSGVTTSSQYHHGVISRLLVYVPYHGFTAINWTPSTNPDPTRVTDRVDECVKRDGTVIKRNVTSPPYTHLTMPATGVKIPSSPCLAGESSGSIDVTERRPDLGTAVGTGTKVLSTPTTTQVPSISDPGNPCGAANGWACETSPWVKPTGSDTWLQCGAQLACPNLSPTPDTTPGATPQTGTTPGGDPWQCRQNGVTLNLSVCGPLLNSPTVTERETDPTTGNPRTTPRVAPTPTYAPPAPTPGVGGSPIAPPIRDFWQCAPSGWSLLNPVAYVYGSACVLTWAFVPPSLSDITDPLITDISAKPPGSLIIGGVAGLGAAYASYNTPCTSGINFWYLVFPCTPPSLGGMMPFMKGIMATGLVFGTLFQLWRMADGALGGRSS